MIQEAWVGVDLDGTLARYDGWKGIHYIGAPIASIVNLIRSLVDNGIRVRIFTARCQEGPVAVEYVVNWCIHNLGMALPVTDKKDFGLIGIIDDRAIGVEINTGKFLSELPDFIKIAGQHWSPDNPNSPTYCKGGSIVCISLDHPAEMKALEEARIQARRGVEVEKGASSVVGFKDESGHGYYPTKEPTRVFTTGATRDADDTKLDYEGFISPLVLRRYAEYMHKCRLRNIPPGQQMRSSDNWQKGIPKEAYVKSLIRHVMEAWIQHDESNDIDDDTLCAIMFNAMGYLFEKHTLRNTQQIGHGG